VNRYLPLLLLLLSLLPAAGRAQQQPATGWSSLRMRTVAGFEPVQLLDSLTVAAPLLAVHDSAGTQLLPASLFFLRYNRLYIDTAGLRAFCPTCRRLQIHYRVLPVDLAAAIRRIDTTAIRRTARPDAIEFDYAPYEPPTRPWESAGLVSNGAYTRGLSFGNSQNLVFNSNLNLQLAGKLGNDVELEAALSDNSLPLQPDGTTRQLQEFDRILSSCAALRRLPKPTAISSASPPATTTSRGRRAISPITSSGCRARPSTCAARAC
jgi:hypothetical protein